MLVSAQGGVLLLNNHFSATTSVPKAKGCSFFRKSFGENMERHEAIAKLKELTGRDLHQLAYELDIAVHGKNGKVNKGWAGHVCERYLGLPLNSAQSPNFGSWELKSVPLKRMKSGMLQFKETMAITMIDPYNVREKEFRDSHLLAKLRKAVIVARIVGSSTLAVEFTPPRVG